MARMSPERVLAEQVLARRPDIYRTLLKALTGGHGLKELIPLFISYHEDLTALGLAKLPAAPRTAAQPRPLLEDDDPPAPPPPPEQRPSAITVQCGDSSAPAIVPQAWIDAWAEKLGESLGLPNIMRALTAASVYYEGHPAKRCATRNLRGVLTRWLIRELNGNRGSDAPRSIGTAATGTIPAPPVSFDPPASCPWLGEWWAYHLARFPEHGAWLAKQPNAKVLWVHWGDSMRSATLAIAKGCTDDLAAGRLGEANFPATATRTIWTEAGKRGREAARRMAKARQAVQQPAQATDDDEDFSCAAEFRRLRNAKR